MLVLKSSVYQYDDVQDYKPSSNKGINSNSKYSANYSRNYFIYKVTLSNYEITHRKKSISKLLIKFLTPFYFPKHFTKKAQ